MSLAFWVRFCWDTHGIYDTYVVKATSYLKNYPYTLTLHVQSTHDAVKGLSKYPKVVHVHYFCTIALQTSFAYVSVA